jgi:hypothetical protein
MNPHRAQPGVFPKVLEFRQHSVDYVQQDMDRRATPVLCHSLDWDSTGHFGACPSATEISRLPSESIFRTRAFEICSLRAEAPGEFRREEDTDDLRLSDRRDPEFLDVIMHLLNGSALEHPAGPQPYPH